MDECPRGEHTHGFFELVYTMMDMGKQRIIAAPETRHVLVDMTAEM